MLRVAREVHCIDLTRELAQMRKKPEPSKRSLDSIEAKTKQKLRKQKPRVPQHLVVDLVNEEPLEVGTAAHNPICFE